jgi:hypothetical protein
VYRRGRRIGPAHQPASGIGLAEQLRSPPAAITVFPGGIDRAPRRWAERSYHQLIYFHEVDKGAHFASWEEPALLAAEMRAAFRSLR